MRKYIGSVVAIAIAIAFAGCASSTASDTDLTTNPSDAVSIANQSLERQHSPLRWEAILDGDGSILGMRLAPLSSGLTNADRQLTADIKKLLRPAEASKGLNSRIVVNDTKIPDSTSAARKETWILEAKDGLHFYNVEMWPSPNGGTDVHVEGTDDNARGADIHAFFKMKDLSDLLVLLADMPEVADRMVALEKHYKQAPEMEFAKIIEAVKQIPPGFFRTDIDELHPEIPPSLAYLKPIRVYGSSDGAEIVLEKMFDSEVTLSVIKGPDLKWQVRGHFGDYMQPDEQLWPKLVSK